MAASRFEERVKNLERKHFEIYGSTPEGLDVVRAPFRICPLGAHVDHQNGIVMGMALNHSIALVYRPNDDGVVRLRSMNFPGEKEFSLKEPMERAHDWSDYARGAAMALKKSHELRTGIDGVLEGDMPIGGLSSSAACGVAYLLALEAVNGIRVSAEDNIELDRLIENEFIGLNNGILDQSMILLAEKNKLLYLDCESAKYRYVEPPHGMAEFDILVVYSGVAQKLEDTDYNKRVSECQAAARSILELEGRSAPEGETVKLRHVKPREFQKHAHALELNQAKRATHFFTECTRVQQGYRAWQDGDLVTLGWLMMESGVSSIQNYECGCQPLITLTNILNQTPGVYGARFSGAGFRGCCIGFSDPQHRDVIRDAVELKYPRQHPEYAEDYRVFFCRVGQGAHVR